MWELIDEQMGPYLGTGKGEAKAQFGAGIAQPAHHRAEGDAHVVVEDEDVRLTDQIEVALPRDVARLDDRDPHPALCAVAGALLGPLLAVQVGMGENILILAFVVIVIGGFAALLVAVPQSMQLSDVIATLTAAGASVRSQALVGSHATRYTVPPNGAKP